MNQNRLLNKYTSNGSLKLYELNELLGEDLPLDDLVRPFNKLRMASSSHQGNQYKKNNKHQNQRNQTQFQPYSKQRIFSHRKLNFQRNYRSVTKKRNYVSQNNITESKLYSNFVPISSSWEAIYQFGNSDFENIRSASFDEVEL